MERFIPEISALVKLALPVSLAQLALVGMSATDVLIAGNAGTVELAGMNLGVNIWNMIILFFMGIGYATQPLVAKRFGAGDQPGVKHQLHQSLWLGGICGLVGWAVVLISAQLMTLLDFEPRMMSIAYEYLLVVSLCAIPMVMVPAARGALEGMNLTRPVLAVNMAAFLLNIPLDYIFVNGLYGFPKMGGVGCAWATVILVWGMFLCLLLMLAGLKAVKTSRLLSEFSGPDRGSIMYTLALGLPIGFSIIIELSMFSGAGLLIAAFGPVEVSAHAVAITVASMSFMLYMGLAQGVTIRASQFLGAKRPDDAWYTVKAGTLFNLMIAGIMCALFLLFPEQLVRLFSDDATVLSLAVVLLYFGAAFQLADSLQVAVLCALRAYHDTSSPPKYQLVAFWGLGLPVGVGLAFYGWWPGLEGAKGLWFAMVLSLFIVGLMLLKRLYSMAGHLQQEFSKGEAKVREV